MNKRYRIGYGMMSSEQIKIFGGVGEGGSTRLIIIMSVGFNA